MSVSWSIPTSQALSGEVAAIVDTLPPCSTRLGMGIWVQVRPFPCETSGALVVSFCPTTQMSVAETVWI